MWDTWCSKGYQQQLHAWCSFPHACKCSLMGQGKWRHRLTCPFQHTVAVSDVTPGHAKFKSCQHREWHYCTALHSYPTSNTISGLLQSELVNSAFGQLSGLTQDETGRLNMQAALWGPVCGWVWGQVSGVLGSWHCYRLHV